MCHLQTTNWQRGTFNLLGQQLYVCMFHIFLITSVAADLKKVKISNSLLLQPETFAEILQVLCNIG